MEIDVVSLILRPGDSKGLFVPGSFIMIFFVSPSGEGGVAERIAS